MESRFLQNPRKTIIGKLKFGYFKQWGFELSDIWKIEGSRNRDSTAFVSFDWFAVHDLFLSLFLAGTVLVISQSIMVRPLWWQLSLLFWLIVRWAMDEANLFKDNPGSLWTYSVYVIPRFKSLNRKYICLPLKWMVKSLILITGIFRTSNLSDKIGPGKKTSQQM